MKTKRTRRMSTDKSNKQPTEDDIFLLQRPLHTSITGVSKLLQTFQQSTQEVRGYITHECDILYECRVCKSIFRGVSNFVMHKRTFCQNKCTSILLATENNDNYSLNVLHPDEEKKTDEVAPKKTIKKNLSTIVESLAQKKHFGFEVDNFSMAEFYRQLRPENPEEVPKENKVMEIHSIPGTSAGVFQTLTNGVSEDKTDVAKTEMNELETKLEGQTVILSPEGKAMNLNPKKDEIKIDDNDEPLKLICTECNITFSTKKTLNCHLKYKHKSTRLVYPCLDCTDTFSTIWSVYRHLYNVHRKTVPQVRKMRAQIQAKVRIANDVPPKDEEAKAERLNEQEKIDEENQAWMDNFETDNDIQMCGGCGRRFERKAALNSHSQTCQKRIAAKNLINVNRLKRIAGEDKHSERKSAKQAKLDNGDVEKKEKSKSSKKAKIGIQIRYDYNKTDKSTPPEATTPNSAEENAIEVPAKKNEETVVTSNNKEDVAEVIAEVATEVAPETVAEPVVETVAETVVETVAETVVETVAETVVETVVEIAPTEEPKTDAGTVTEQSTKYESETDELDLNDENKNCEEKSYTPAALYSIIGIPPITKEPANTSANLPEEIIEAEVVSINSSNSSKEERDPLSLKDVPDGSDSEIEEILGPNPAIKIYEHERISQANSDQNIRPCSEELNEQYKITEINENTLKLIKLMNSDVPESKFRTLDEQMLTYVNMRRLQCMPCDIRFSNVSKLRYHMSLHFNWMRFRCDICSFKAYDKTIVHNHIKDDHNIQGFKRIEAVLMTIPEWETVEHSSKELLPLSDIENDVECHESLTSISGEKKKYESPRNITPDQYIIPEIETNTLSKNYKGRVKPVQKNRKAFKVKRKIEEAIDQVSEAKEGPVEEMIVDSGEGEDTDPSSSVSTSGQSDAAEAELKKMVYEVIFGDNDKNKRVDATGKPATVTRPVRNRVKPIDKDFIYDMTEIEKGTRSVLSTNARYVTQTLTQIPDCLNLESNQRVKAKVVKKPHHKPVPVDTCKNAKHFSFTAIKSEPGVDEEDCTTAAVGTEALAPACLHASPESADDDDIYIVEGNTLYRINSR